MKKSLNYDLVSKRAGVAASICIIAWVISMFCTALFKNDNAWIGVVCGVSFLATLASAVTCLFTAVMGHFKSRALHDEPTND